MKYFKRFIKAAPVTALAITAVLGNTSCERRDLYVFQDQFKQVQVNIDWRNYDRDRQLYPHTPDPAGMTLWFFPRDGRKSYRYTSSQVNQYETYLSEGIYDALVIDYSPEEYGKQEFTGMDFANTAKVQSTPDPYQPDDTKADLCNAMSYSKALLNTEANGRYTVMCQPEAMASDTLNMRIYSGRYNNYIPYKERDTYQSTLIRQFFYMEPRLVPWHMRVRIPIKGIYYLRTPSGSIAGLADGYYLVKCETSDTPCIMLLDDWQVYVTGDNVGYIACTFTTWGLRNSMWADKMKEGVPPYKITETAKDEIRINLSMLLRDRKTVKSFHIDCGNQVSVFCSEYALSIDLRDQLADNEIPELPYVEGVNGLDLGGVVVPWQEGENPNVTF